MKPIYKMKNEWEGHTKHSYYHNEYFRDGDEVVKFKCGRFKFFDGRENEWSEEKKEEQRWSINDPNIPEWLKKFI